MNKQLVAVVLAGGQGQRFFPLTTNKALFPYFGKPLIAHSVIDALPKEVARVVIVTSDGNNSQIQNLKFPVPVDTVLQPKPLGMADAIVCAKEYLKDCSLLVINADDVTDPGLFGSVVDQAKKTDAFGVIPGWKAPHYMPMGYLALDGQKITSIVEKPAEGTQPSPFIYTVGYFIRDSAIYLDQLSRTKSAQDDAHELTLSTLMKKYDFQMHEYMGGFASLKYPWHVLDVMDQLFKRMKAHQGSNLDIRSYVTIEGAVYIGDNVKIMEHTKIVGPCYIGNNSVIGNNNLIRASHIGDNSVTGFGTDISRSYVGDYCWFHSNYIGDSVFEKNVSMGSGSVLANLRLDERDIFSVVGDEKVNTHKTKLGAVIGGNVRIGVNASIMPGVKIGSGSFVGAGVTVTKDLPEGKFSMSDTDYNVVDNTRTLVENARNEFRKKLS